MRDRAKRAIQTASERQATLQRKSMRKKGKRNLQRDRNVVTADERQTGSGKLRGERLKITQTKTNQHAELAGEITLVQQRSTNQREWI